MAEKKKGLKQTCPENAGAKNIPTEVLEKSIDPATSELGSKLSELFNLAMVRMDYKGKWSDEEFRDMVMEYFDYMSTNGLKPSKSSLRVWLACSTTQYQDWVNKPEKYPFKSEILKYAHDIMATQYISRGESFPTFNQFLLKTGHGYNETTKVEITDTSSENIKDTIAKLGLDKTE